MALGRGAGTASELMPAVGEFDLIGRIRQRATQRDDVLHGIGDDAAVLRPPPGRVLAVSVDTLNAGVHFPLGTAAADIGWKSLAVNLSDLAAMGAEPAWCTLSLSLPEADADWIDAFLDGFLELAARHGVALVGGDTTRGPLAVSVTVIGQLPEGHALLRSAAREGDDVWVTGCLGDAAAGLALLQKRVSDLEASLDAAAATQLLQRLHRPTPRVSAGLALRDLAHACIDVSDGLFADLGHVLESSGKGACIELAALPASSALCQLTSQAQRWPLQVAGGDDYELCFTAAPESAAAIRTALRASDTPAARIGRITAERGLVALQPDGSRWTPPRMGFQHFEGSTP